MKIAASILVALMMAMTIAACAPMKDTGYAENHPDAYGATRGETTMDGMDMNSETDE